MQTLIGKASILLEALPYIKNFYGETFVIKYGGSAFTDENLRTLFAKDIVLLKYIGINPIIVHGGGPQISSFLKKLNIPTEFVGGLRITTKEVMQIVEMVLCGFVNKDIVSLINSHGGNAVGISGKDANLLFVKKVFTQKYLKNLGIEENVEKDVGYVGEIIKVKPE
ncbi:MAG TPA: acetylglutamate kinase, partial [Desulfurobacteriaceae bacterium]|nr:acetylglutamate kinase [Desulfurobacteriaceae bacterium]